MPIDIVVHEPFGHIEEAVDLVNNAGWLKAAGAPPRPTFQLRLATINIRAPR